MNEDGDFEFNDRVDAATEYYWMMCSRALKSPNKSARVILGVHDQIEDFEERTHVDPTSPTAVQTLTSRIPTLPWMELASLLSQACFLRSGLDPLLIQGY